MNGGSGKKGMGSSGMAGIVYCLGFIGAAVYYISHAEGFGMGVVGFLKALVWPAFLVHGLLDFVATWPVV